MLDGRIRARFASALQLTNPLSVCAANEIAALCAFSPPACVAYKRAGCAGQSLWVFSTICTARAHQIRGRVCQLACHRAARVSVRIGLAVQHTAFDTLTDPIRPRPTRLAHELPRTGEPLVAFESTSRRSNTAASMTFMSIRVRDNTSDCAPVRDACTARKFSACLTGMLSVRSVAWPASERACIAKLTGASLQAAYIRIGDCDGARAHNGAAASCAIALRDPLPTAWVAADSNLHSNVAADLSLRQVMGDLLLCLPLTCCCARC